VARSTYSAHHDPTLRDGELVELSNVFTCSSYAYQVRTTEPKSNAHKKNHFGRANRLYIDEREIITYAKA
jgi:hypothetical protein